MTPRATYRLQFNGEFTFADAQKIVPYLHDLGISHIYASPITTARSGSLHGYDVVDPTRVNPELGGEDGLRALAGDLKRHGMGLIVDIVPNHMGIAGGENAWWNDVLARGQASPFADFFDIDWEDKLLLPFLGEPLVEALEHGALELHRGADGAELRAYGEHRFPLRPEDRNVPLNCDLPELLERQHYRLCWWRRGNDELHWRRFFTITELASLQVHDPKVFEATHALVFRLHDEGLIDGVRVDHIDGLADPATYCSTLREKLGPEAYIVVEKILAPQEHLPEGWEIDGTTGYDFMEQVAALLHNWQGERELTQLWAETSGQSGDFAAEELQARQDMLSWEFEAQLSACVEVFAELARSDDETRSFTDGMLRRALRVLLWSFPAYRTYGTGDSAPASDERLREQARLKAEPLAPPGEMPVIDQVLAWLAGNGAGDAALATDAVRRFQQLSAPIAAKAVEDTAFYRYGRLLSRNDVGFDPARFSIGADDFAAASAERARRFPHALLATATHDHKRGEDVRARLAVLSDIPDIWRDHVARWEALSKAGQGAMDPADRYMLWQTLFGAWPDGLEPTDAVGLHRFAKRVAAWQEKALREAKLRSSWADPAEEYEQACRDRLQRLLDPAKSPAVLNDIAVLVRNTQGAALANSLVQVALKCTLPGVPDVYQGCELTDLSLVDPDNRRPVDFALRQEILEDPSRADPKFRLVRDLLALRRKWPSLFAKGEFVPAEVEGPRSEHVFVFSRQHDGCELQVAVALHLGRELYGQDDPTAAVHWWDHTKIAFRANSPESMEASAMFRDAPIWIRFENADPI